MPLPVEASRAGRAGAGSLPATKGKVCAPLSTMSNRNSHRGGFRGLSTVIVLWWAAFRLAAQDGSLDTSFQSPVFPLTIPLIEVEANGKVIYAHAPDGLHYTIGRLSANGTAENSINTGD